MFFDQFYPSHQAVLFKPQSYTCMSFRLGDADAALDPMKVQETYKSKYHKIVELFTIRMMVIAALFVFIFYDKF